MTRTIFALASIAAALAAPAFAHHSFAIFDQSKILYTSGTVKEYELVNPHAWLHLNITGADGKAATWSFEAGSVAQLASLGWKQDTFKVGDKVEVGFRPMRDGSRGGQFMSAKLPNGQTLCSNRGCGDGSGKVLPAF
jgi:Family of unknown function (DUF6152)